MALDTSVIFSHFKETGSQKTRRTSISEVKETLLISETVYTEIYAGIHLSLKPEAEKRNVQKLLAANNVKIQLSNPLKVAKRAGEIYTD